MMSMYGSMDHPPPAYALMHDKTESDFEYYRKNEGLHLLTWNTNNSPDGKRDFTGLEAYLMEINRLTNPVLKFTVHPKFFEIKLSLRTG